LRWNFGLANLKKGSHCLPNYELSPKEALEELYTLKSLEVKE
jgi:hypothetical protein